MLREIMHIKNNQIFSTAILSFFFGTVISCSTSFQQFQSHAESEECKAIWYDSPADDPRCYELQKQLFDATVAGHMHGIETAIQNGANVNGGYYQSLPLLEVAASKGNNIVIEALIDAKANINRVRAFGQTALKTAVNSGHVDTVKILLEKGVDVCEKTENTALQLAIESGHAEIVSLLIDSGAKNCS